MKSKLLMFVLALCMVVPCAVAFSACKKNDYTKNHCKISVATLPDKIDWFGYTPSQGYTDNKTGEDYDYFTKGELSSIEFRLKTGYELTDLSNFLRINNKTVTVVKCESGDATSLEYKYEFRPTDKKISISFNQSVIGLRTVELQLFTTDHSDFLDPENQEMYGTHVELENYRIIVENQSGVQLAFIEDVASILGEVNKRTFTCKYGENIVVKLFHVDPEKSKWYLPTAGNMEHLECLSWETSARQGVVRGTYQDTTVYQVVETITLKDKEKITYDLINFPRAKDCFYAEIRDGDWRFDCFSFEIEEVQDSTNMTVTARTDLLNCRTFQYVDDALGTNNSIAKVMDDGYVTFGHGYGLDAPCTYYEAGSQESYDNKDTYVFETNLYRYLMESGTSTPGYETRQCAEEKRHNDVQMINGGDQIYYVNGSIVNNGEYDEFQCTSAIVATKYVKQNVGWYEEEQYLIYNDSSNDLWLDIDILRGLDTEYPEEIWVNVEFVNGETSRWDVTLKYGTYCLNQGDDSVAYDAENKHVYVKIEGCMDVAYVTIIPQ